jgi:DNA-binding SARP family transcriptional activator/TolB-like protein
VPGCHAPNILAADQASRYNSDRQIRPAFAAALSSPGRPALSVRCFGGARIESEGRPLQGTATQRHRLALLGLLATSWPRALPRDRLIACLWPERDAEHARNLLNQAVHALRKALGADAILFAGDELRFEPGELQVDVIAFEAALSSGRAERAVELYAGPFLDGFFLPDAPEFESWVDGERDRLRRAYCGALEELAERAMTGQDPIRAVERWHRLAAEEPYNARVTLRLMEALDASGDRAAALQQGSLHALLLEQEFGAEPDPQVTALAEQLRSVAALPPPLPEETRELAESPLEAASPAASQLAESAEPAAPASAPRASGAAWTPPQIRRLGNRNPGRRCGHRSGRCGVGGLAVAGSERGLGGGAGVRQRQHKSIAVLPFENLSQRQEDGVFSEGIHSDLITALSGIAALTVISRASVLPYRDQARPLPEIGAELGVDVLVEGAVQRLGERMRVNVQLSDAQSGRLLWARTYDHEVSVGNLFALPSAIVEGIVASLETSLTPAERARLAATATENLTAYLYYHRAGEMADNTRAGNEESERLLRLALEADPRFAAAWAGLAGSCGWRPPYLGFPTSVWDSALVYAQRALELDPNHADAYTALAQIHGHQGHLRRQEQMAREALRRNPSAGLAMRRLAESYRERGVFVEALRYHRESVRLSPNSPSFRSWVAHVYADLGELAEAERWYHAVLSLRPDFVNALQGLALLNVQNVKSRIRRSTMPNGSSRGTRMKRLRSPASQWLATSCVISDGSSAMRGARWR